MPLAIRQFKRVGALALAMLLPAAHAESFIVGIDTTPLAGQQGFVAIDLYQGDASLANTVTISAFSSQGPLGTPILFGDAQMGAGGSVTLRSSVFYSGLLQPLQFPAGPTVFTLNLDLLAAPGIAPDSVAVFLLDAARLPYATEDPTGAGALLVLDLRSPPVPQVYGSPFASVSVIPEPGRLLLMLAGLAGLLAAVALHNAPLRATRCA
jgi:hypothetical protein